MALSFPRRRESTILEAQRGSLSVDPRLRGDDRESPIAFLTIAKITSPNRYFNIILAACLTIVTAGCFRHKQPPPPPSRESAKSDSGMVSSATQEATLAGLQILREGG